MSQTLVPLFALALTACAHTAAAPWPAPLPPKSEWLVPKSEWLVPTSGADTVVLPAGDPSARDLPDDQSDLPPVRVGALNTNPQRKYRLHGRKPPGFNVMFASRFHGYGFRTPECQALMRAQGVSPTFEGEFFRRLAVRQTEDKYEATLVIDRFSDDACRWVYQGTRILFESPKAIGPLNPENYLQGATVVTPDYYHTDDVVMPCPQYRPRCNPAHLAMVINASAEPVMIRCQTFPADLTMPNPQSWFSCQDINRAYKERQILKPDTRDIRIDVYDLDIDADPIEGWPNPPAAFPKAWRWTPP